MAEPSNPASTERDGIPLVRSSERGSFKNCMKQWSWSYVDQIVPLHTDLGAREEGTGIHLAMAEYYIPGRTRGRPMLETWLEWCEETRREAVRTDKGRKAWNEKNLKGVTGKEVFEEMRDRGVHILTEYMKEYGVEGVVDPDWEVICREETFAANINNEAINVGTIDLVVRRLSDNTIWIVDHKTGKGFPNEAWYRIDDQGGSYGAIATQILRRKELIAPNERVKGVIFNFIVKRNADPRPKNADGLYCNKPVKADYVKHFLEDDFDPPYEEAELKKKTLKQLEELAEYWDAEVLGEVSKTQPSKMFDRYEIERTPRQQKKQLQRVVDDVKVMSMARNGQLPILKSPGKLCPYCDFFQLCELDESCGDTESMISTLFKKRDPYHDHRDGSENSKLSVKADANLKHGS